MDAGRRYRRLGVAGVVFGLRYVMASRSLLAVVRERLELMKVGRNFLAEMRRHPCAEGHAGTMCLSAAANKDEGVCGQVRSLEGVRVRVRFRLAGVPIGGGACSPEALEAPEARPCRPWPPRTVCGQMHLHTCTLAPCAQRPVPSPKLLVLPACTALAARAAPYRTQLVRCLRPSRTRHCRRIFPNA